MMHKHATLRAWDRIHGFMMMPANVAAKGGREGGIRRRQWHVYSKVRDRHFHHLRVLSLRNLVPKIHLTRKRDGSSSPAESRSLIRYISTGSSLDNHLIPSSLSLSLFHLISLTRISPRSLLVEERESRENQHPQSQSWQCR